MVMVMRRIAMLLVGLVVGWSWVQGAIVRNATTGVTAEDSVAVVFGVLDSIGNPTTADSLVVAVSGPSGALVFRDSVAIGDGRITADTISGCPVYAFADLAAGLGADRAGNYRVLLVAKNSALNLQTVHRTSFQVVNRRLAEALDQIDDSVWVRGGAVDSNRTEQGAGDSSQIAAWVWNTPQSGHVLPGTFGSYVDANISGLGMGGGAYAVTVVAYDSVLSQPVAGVRVAVRNQSQTALMATAATDSEGEVSVNLDAGDYAVVATAPGYQFAAAHTLTVAGAATDTVTGGRFDPGTPSLPGLCRVYGYVYGIDGRPIEGARIEARLPDGVNGASILIVAPFAVETDSDESGYFFVDLIPSAELQPVVTDYEITISASGRTLYRKRVTVPSQAALWLVP
jgi:hypothetical protein